MFYPYGQDRSRIGAIKSEYRFTGKELDDETGLHYFGARYYDSATGRFVSVDPLILDKTEKIINYPQQLNAYGYPTNPYNFTDKNGESWMPVVAGAFIAIVAFPLTASVTAAAVAGLSIYAVGTALENFAEDRGKVLEKPTLEQRYDALKKDYTPENGKGSPVFEGVKKITETAPCTSISAGSCIIGNNIEKASEAIDSKTPSRLYDTYEIGNTSKDVYDTNKTRP